MTIRLGDVTFSDWISLEYEGGFTDTFIFDIDALNGLPPFVYHPLLQRLVAELDKKKTRRVPLDPRGISRGMVSDGSQTIHDRWFFHSLCCNSKGQDAGLSQFLLWSKFIFFLISSPQGG